MRRLVVLLSAVAVSFAVLVACSSEGRADAGPATQLFREASQAAPAVGVPGQQSLAPLIKSLKPAVVNIATTTVTKNPHRRAFPRSPGGPGTPGGPGDPWGEFFERFFGAPRELPEEFRANSLGSGFIINADGFVLTNNHVVKDASDIRVKLADGREFEAKVIGKDAPLDVALIRLQRAPKDLPTVALGDSDALEQGDFVLALGNPFGLRESASFGIVSAKDRAIGAGSYDDFIQTDAAINPGNSGGPLFNMKGEVVGINTAIVSPQIGQGIGFAVPINLAKQILPQLQSKGKVARGYLGVTVSDLTPELAQGFGMPEGSHGAVVQNVLPKAPAGKAGIQAGDVVVALNGKPVETSGQLTRGVATVPPGSKATLTVLRDGKKKDVAVTVAQRPDEEALARGESQEGESEESGAASAEKSKDVKLGVKLGALTPELARELKVEGDGGVVVAEVMPDGPAERAGIQRGDLILEVNRQAVAKPEQVVQIVGKMKPGQVALLRVRRGQTAIFLPVRIPEKQEEKK
jgi:serine protease Do